MTEKNMREKAKNEIKNIISDFDKSVQVGAVADVLTELVKDEGVKVILKSIVKLEEEI